MKKKILIIEDEPSIAENIVYALETEGFAAVWRATGAEGVSEFRAGGFDLLIVDIGLPDANGFDLVREIRRTSGVPLIFLTARSSEIDRVAGLELGADDYVVKPFSPRELSARVRAVLRRSIGGDRPNPQPAQSTGNHKAFIVDDDRKRITFHGVVLELTRYEYRLLQVLAMRPGRVYSREQLMSHVWEEPEMSMDRTVDTHIKTLRQKLKAVRPDDEPIITHRGEGYSLKEG